MLLKNHQSFLQELGKLPRGKYIYRFSVHGQSNKPGKLQVSIESNTARHDPQVIEFSQEISEHELIFECKEDYNQNKILFLGDPVQHCTLKLPVSALFLHETVERPAAMAGLEQNIISLVNALDTSDSLFRRNAELPKIQAQDSTPGSRQMDIKEIENFINIHYFKGFLTIEEATRQLDFVVFEKMFRPDGSKGFTKFKRKFYGKTLRFFYRKLTKNTDRKRYFAKLYRNYINTNALADNLHHQQ